MSGTALGLAAGALLFGAAGQATGHRAPAPTCQDQCEPGVVEVMSLEDGVQYHRNLIACDAVAVALVSGVYDYGMTPDGTLWASVGLSKAAQGHVQVNVSRNRRYCP